MSLTDAPAPPKRTTAKRLIHAAGIVVALAITVLFVWYVARSLRGHDLSVYATPRAAIGIVLAALFWAFGSPLLSLAWKWLLAGLGVRRSVRELFGIVGITQFAKYIPGNLAQYIGRVGMSMARGIPARPLAVTLILETLLIIAAAITVCVGAGTLSDVGRDALRTHGLQLGLIALLIVVAGAGLYLLRRIAPWALRKLAPKYAPALDGTLLPPRAVLARAFVLYCVTYVGTGIGLILLARFLLPGAPHDYWLLIAVFALAWVVGFVTPGAPGGLGVREGLMLLMLAPVYSTAAAGVLVIAFRIATTFGDVLTLAAGAVALPRKGASRVPLAGDSQPAIRK